MTALRIKKRSSYIPIQVPGFDLKGLEARLRARGDIDGEIVRIALETLNFSAQLCKGFRVRDVHSSKRAKQKITAAILLLRLIDLFESILVLAAGRPQQDLKSLFRIFLEAYFLFGNVCVDADFVVTYFQTDAVNRLRLLNAGAKHDHEMFRQLNRYAEQGAREQLNEQIKREGIRALEVYRYAEKIGCAHVYDSMYRITSAQVHTTPRCLEGYVEADSKGNILKISSKQDKETAQQAIYDVTCFLFKALRGICELFDSNKVNGIKKLEIQLEAASQRLLAGA